MDNNLSFLDFLTIFSVGLQVSGYQQNLKQASTDDLMRELQKQDREYLEKIIESRLSTSSIGFNAEIVDKNQRSLDDLLLQVMPQDLTKYGLIPEFIGRVPVVVSLRLLDEQALVKILSEPKNALTKQYEKLFELDDVKLEFTDDALLAIAKEAVERKTGARGLRSIIEKVMTDIMYEIPKDDNIGRVTITREYVEGTGGPVIDIRKDGYSFDEIDQMKKISEKEQD